MTFQDDIDAIAEYDEAKERVSELRYRVRTDKRSIHRAQESLAKRQHKLDTVLLPRYFSLQIKAKEARNRMRRADEEVDESEPEDELGAPAEFADELVGPLPVKKEDAVKKDDTANMEHSTADTEAAKPPEDTANMEHSTADKEAAKPPHQNVGYGHGGVRRVP